LEEAFDLDLGTPEELRGGTSWAHFWRPRADLLVTRVRGRIDVPIVEAYVARADRAIVRGVRPHVFHDWYDVDGYDAEARRRYREWGTTHKDEFASRVYLVRSKILAMALSAAAVAVGIDMKIHAKREPFLAALRPLLARPTMRPPGA